MMRVSKPRNVLGPQLTIVTLVYVLFGKLKKNLKNKGCTGYPARKKQEQIKKRRQIKLQQTY